MLVKQDPAEAKDTVTKRIEYITKEMYVIMIQSTKIGTRFHYLAQFRAIAKP